MTEGTEMDFYELSDNIVLGWHFTTSTGVYGGIEVLAVINIATLLQYNSCFHSAAISVNH